jgi:hypothetical protein
LIGFIKNLTKITTVKLVTKNFMQLSDMKFIQVRIYILGKTKAKRTSIGQNVKMKTVGVRL